MPKPVQTSPLPFAAQCLVYGLLSLFACLFAYCAYQRVAYPYELEWLEGEMLCHALQIMQGLPVFAPPSSQFVAELYPPVYYYVIAAVFKLAGSMSFQLLRLPSLGSLAGILVLLYRAVRREGGSRAVALLAPGLFLSLYEIHGAWYDIGRVDMVFYLFILAGLYCLAYVPHRIAALCAGALLLALATYTKQSAAYYFPFAALYLLLQSRKEAVLFTAISAVLVLGFFFGLNYFSDGWFAQYAFFNPIRYNELLNKPIEQIPFKMLFEFRDRIWPEIRYEMFYKVPVIVCLGAGYLLLRLSEYARGCRVNMWELSALPAVISYFSIRPHLGSERNDFMYITIWGCLLVALALVRLSGLQPGRLRDSLRFSAYGMLGLQLCLQLYSPQKVLPPPGSAEMGREILQRIADIPGPVFLPYHSWYGMMAGKEKLMNGGAYWAYQILTREPFHPAELIEKIRRRHFAAIILDDRAYMLAKGDRVEIDNMKLFMTSGDELAEEIETYYQVGGRLPYGNDDVFRDPTGLATRPELILVPKP